MFVKDEQQQLVFPFPLSPSSHYFCYCCLTLPSNHSGNLSYSLLLDQWHSHNLLSYILHSNRSRFQVLQLPIEAI